MLRCLVIVAGLLQVTIACGQYEKAERVVRTLLAENKPIKAAAKCEPVLMKKDAPPVFRVLRADAYVRMGEYAKAKVDIDIAKAALGETMEVRSQLIGVYLGLGKTDSALAMIQMPIEVGADEEYLFRVGSTYQKLKDWRTAVGVFDKAVAAFPSAARTYRERGSCYAMLGDSAKARTDLDQAVALGPRDAVNYNSRGVYRYALFGDHAKAVVEYNRAIKQDPNYGYAFSNRGWSRYKLGEVEKARKDLVLAVRKNRGNAYAYRSLGIMDLDAGNKESACANFTKALDRNFTASYGAEVEDLMRANCAALPVAPTIPVVPQVIPPSNAPNGPPPKTGNAP